MMGEKNSAPAPRDLLERISEHVASEGPQNIPVRKGPTEPASAGKSISDRQTKQSVHMAPAGPATNGPTPPKDGADRNSR